jgi:hypothetical protein
LLICQFSTKADTTANGNQHTNQTIKKATTTNTTGAFCNNASNVLTDGSKSDEKTDKKITIDQWIK